MLDRFLSVENDRVYLSISGRSVIPSTEIHRWRDRYTTRVLDESRAPVSRAGTKKTRGKVRADSTRCGRHSNVPSWHTAAILSPAFLRKRHARSRVAVKRKIDPSISRFIRQSGKLASRFWKTT